jgi:hypothetical protein
MVLPANHPFIDGFSIINHSFWVPPFSGNLRSKSSCTDLSHFCSPCWDPNSSGSFRHNRPEFQSESADEFHGHEMWSVHVHFISWWRCWRNQWLRNEKSRNLNTSYIHTYKKSKTIQKSEFRPHNLSVSMGGKQGSQWFSLKRRWKWLCHKGT